jgi:hypothetical protein
MSTIFNDPMILPGTATIVLSGSSDPYGGSIQNAINGTGGPGLPTAGGVIDARASGVASVTQGVVDPGLSKSVTILLGPWTYTFTQIKVRSGLRVIGSDSQRTVVQASSSTASQTVPALFCGPASTDPTAISVLFQDFIAGSPTGTSSTPTTPNYLDCFHFDASNATSVTDCSLVSAVWNRVSVLGFGGVNWKFLGGQATGHVGNNQFLSFYDCASYTNIGPGMAATENNGLSLTAAAAASGGDTVYTGTIASSFSITSVANASGGNTVYTGTITGGGSNASFLGLQFTATGFAHGANNGTFVCVAATSTTITLNNANGVADTTGQIAQSYVGFKFIVSGFSNSANNGPFTCVASTTTTMTLNNPSGVAQSGQTAFALGVPAGPAYMALGLNFQHFWYNGQFNSATYPYQFVDVSNANCPLVYIGNSGLLGISASPYVFAFHGITIQGRAIAMQFDGCQDVVVRKGHFEVNFTSFYVTYGTGISGGIVAPGGTNAVDSGLVFAECSFNGNTGIQSGLGSILQVSTSSVYGCILKDCVYASTTVSPDNWLLVTGSPATIPGVALQDNTDTHLAFGSTASNPNRGSVNQGVVIVGSVNLTGETASIGATAMYTVPAGQQGIYRITLELECTTAGTGGTVTAGTTYTNRSGSSSEDPITGSVSLTTKGFESYGSAEVWCAAGSTINYETTVAGAAGGPQYAFSARVEYLG